MNNQINELLTKIRRGLEEGGARGPYTSDDASTMDDEAAAGDLGAENSEVDALDAFLTDLADQIVANVDYMDYEEALDIVFDCADSLAETGDLPEMPDDDASADELSLWLGKARSVGFGALCMKMARE